MTDPESSDAPARPGFSALAVGDVRVTAGPDTAHPHRVTFAYHLGPGWETGIRHVVDLTDADARHLLDALTRRLDTRRPR